MSDPTVWCFGRSLWIRGSDSRSTCDYSRSPASLHFEAQNPTIQLSTIEIWSVRTQKRFAWQRSVLVRLQSDLSARLAEVSEELGRDAA